MPPFLKFRLSFMCPLHNSPIMLKTNITKWRKGIKQGYFTKKLRHERQKELHLKAL